MPNVELAKEPGLARGERAILVDGVRWGRTRVTMHGCHGTKHVFVQEGGRVLATSDDDKYAADISVRSQKRHGFNDPNWRPTHERVLEKARELVETGRLRHPDIVKEERERALEEYRRTCAEHDARERERLRVKALEFLRDACPHGVSVTLLNSVVAAMLWAKGE